MTKTAKKVLAITSSGRTHSNSSRLLSAAAEEAARESTLVIHGLATLTFKGCTGCGSCRNGSDKCVLKDDLTPILAEVAQADALILSAPVYYGQVSGIFKSFLDRWYAYRDRERELRLPSGRPLLLILSHGHPDKTAYEKLVADLERIFTAYGFVPKVMVGFGMETPGDAENKPKFISRAKELGDDIASTL